ncbi:MAG: hexokinase [Kiritimatiellae bacterium]|nr:hexokinase [Kiritimatiellia bacterium]
MDKRISSFFAKHGFSETPDADALLAEFDRQMDAGLAARPSSLAMLPSFIDPSREVPVERPVIVLDAGGTNLRVAAVWFDKSGKARIEDFRKYKMPGTEGCAVSARDFFDAFADFLVPVCRKAQSVGFCFSYPTEIFPDLDGKLLRWSKQIDAPEVVGRKVGSGVAAALAAKTGCSLAVKVLNDTTATLLAGKTAGLARRYSSYVGFILGTGTNIAYIERNERVGKASGLAPAGSTIINVESGGFASAPRSDFDRAAVAKLKNPDEGLFEKMISGAYMGSVGLEVLKTAAAEGLFSPAAAARFAAMETLSTKEFDDFTANPFAADNALAALRLADEDLRTAMALGEPLFRRAAALTAVNISSAVLRTGEGRDPLHPVCVTIDGSTYYKTRSAMFKSRVEEGLRDILAPRGVFFDTVCVEDAPLVGSAVAGLVA